MTYAISNIHGDHLGFIVMSGGPDAGDCAIRSIAADKAIESTKEFEFLASLQRAGELQWEHIRDEFRINDHEGVTLLVEKGGQMTGSGMIFLVETVV